MMNYEVESVSVNFLKRSSYQLFAGAKLILQDSAALRCTVCRVAQSEEISTYFLCHLLILLRALACDGALLYHAEE